MERLLEEIAMHVKRTGKLGDKQLGRILAFHNRRFRSEERHFAKKQLASAYLELKQSDPKLWQSWGLSDSEEHDLLASIQVKPRRTASGVATITVITKPHPCSGTCVFCPNDVRMPKSYLHDEPACQRAQRCYFDPYLQVANRLSALERMGHATDKVELIVLGGSFTDYPKAYQIWFASELYRALNEADEGLARVTDVFADVEREEQDESTKRGRVPSIGNTASRERSSIPPSPFMRQVAKRIQAYHLALEPTLKQQGRKIAELQAQVDASLADYNSAVRSLYGAHTPWDDIASWQAADLDMLHAQQRANEAAAKRAVGLVVETRPDEADADTFMLLRQLGCTKIQMGVQTLNEEVAKACARHVSPNRIRAAFELARAFGFKSHAHFMANLPGASLDGDRKDYLDFVGDAAIAADEVKLYPCALIGGTGLEKLAAEGAWQPYGEDELVELLVHDVLATPAPMRISRMIRDFSSKDILAGNKKTNLRQMVEARVAELVAAGAAPVQEIRMREIATGSFDMGALYLDDVDYRTSNSTEHFLQWIYPAPAEDAAANRITAFLRLSLPDTHWVEQHARALPIQPEEAMIREVHVYGAAARLHAPGDSAQHQGLGRQLVERACTIAREAGYRHILVISAVGTRSYYRRLGFSDAGLYQRRML